MTTTSYYLGVDVGTTAAKASAFDRTGAIIGVRQLTYPLHEPSPGAAVQHPTVLLAAARTVVRELIQQLGQPPLAVGLGTAMHSLLLLDEHDHCLTPLITWADTRAHAVAHPLRDSPHGQTIFRSTGTPIHAMSPLCKLLWLRTTQPTLWSRMARVADLKSYLLHDLTGEWWLDHSVASGTGLFELTSKDWYAPALAIAAIQRTQLPTLVTPLLVLPDCRPAQRAAWGLDEGTPIVAGAADGCLANLGAGVVAPGPAVLTIGTSGAVRMTVRSPQTDAHMRLFTYCLHDDYYVVGGASNNGGKVLEWVVNNFYPGRSITDLLAQAATVAAGAEGLLCVPYLYGERAPHWDASASGQLVGLRSHHSRAHLARATVEGILYNLCLSLAALRQTVADPHLIYANGGFTRSTFWVQLLADISGYTVQTIPSHQAAAYGAALLARHATGDWVDGSTVPLPLAEQATFEPNPHYRTLYDERQAAFQQLVSPAEP